MLLRSLLTLIAFTITAVSLNAMSAEDIVKKSIKARKLYKLENVETYHIIGELSNPMAPAPASLEMFMKKPNKFRAVIKANMPNGSTMEIVQVFDGKKGWLVSPQSPDPVEVTGDQLKQMQEMKSIIDGPLTDYKEKGTKIKKLKDGKVNDKSVYRIELTMKTGEVTTLCIDKKTYYPVKLEAEQTQMGQTFTIETYISDYKSVGGAIIAHKHDARQNGNPQMTFTLKKAEVNIKISDSKFKVK